MRRVMRHLSAIDSEGLPTAFCFKKVKGLERVSSKRTNTLGLQAAVGNITLKEALQAAYSQGIFDASLAANLKEGGV